MSRIGKKPVDITSGVTITVNKENEITVKGPKGELKQLVDRDMIVDIQGTTVELKRPTEQIRHRAMQDRKSVV